MQRSGRLHNCCWRATYEGQKVDVNTLENYYPYIQNVELPEEARPTELDYAAIEQRVPVQLARAAMNLDYPDFIKWIGGIRQNGVSFATIISAVFQGDLDEGHLKNV